MGSHLLLGAMNVNFHMFVPLNHHVLMLEAMFPIACIMVYPFVKILEPNLSDG